MEKNNVIVVGRLDFPDAVHKHKDGKWAYISISATPECAEYWLGDIGESKHYLPTGPDVFNIEFDDLEEDLTWKGHVFKAMTREQGKDMLRFIEDHLDCNILVHCRAGRSRSQGVYRFILDFFPDCYEECDENRLNPCITPNMNVLRQLKRAWYEKEDWLSDGEL